MRSISGLPISPTASSATRRSRGSRSWSPAAGDRYVAFETWCTHAECPLGDGWLEGEAIRCACHGVALLARRTVPSLEGPARRSDRHRGGVGDRRRTRGRRHLYAARVSLRLDVTREQALERAAEIVAEGWRELRPRPRERAADRRPAQGAARGGAARGADERARGARGRAPGARRVDRPDASSLLRLRRLVGARDRRARRPARLVLRRQPRGVGGGRDRGRGSGDPLGGGVRRLPGRRAGRSRAAAPSRT